MNEEQLRTKINELIKTQTMREFLLNCLKYECELNNFLNSDPSLIDKAKQRFKSKIKNCQQIETDLPNECILDEESYLLLEKLDRLRLQLATLYAGGKEDEIIKENSNYIEIKNFISEILSKNIKLKLKYFDLIIKLLERAKTGNAESHFKKKFIGALDLLKKFVTEKEYIPNEADLKYIGDLDHGSNESDIRKSFYGIIHELDNKLLFKDLLKQLLEIIKNKNDSPFLFFSDIFIRKCLEDAQMDADDLHQILHIMHSAFKDYNEQGKKKKFNSFSIDRLISNDLIDLNKFEKDRQEKISRSITDNLPNQSLQKQESVQVAFLKEFDFGTFFPTYVNNKKIRLKLHNAKVVYNEKFEKNITTDNSLSKFFRADWGKVRGTATKLITKGKAITTDTVATLEAFAESSSNRFTSLIKKNPATSSSQECEGTDQTNLDNSLTQAKEKLSSIKIKLTIWDPILGFHAKPLINQHNLIDNDQINITQVIAAFDESINEKYSSINLQILGVFEKINTNIKEKNYWLAESENKKISLAYKRFRRGYLNIDFSREKFKTKFGDAPSFDKINNFISGQSFWSLLFTYRIICWPWRKNDLADTWAQQLCLQDVINQTMDLKDKLSSNNHEGLVEKIIVLLNAFPPYKKSEVVAHIRNDFKEYIVAQLNQLETLELKINDCLNKKIDVTMASDNRSQPRLFPVCNLSRSATGVSSQPFPTPIFVN